MSCGLQVLDFDREGAVAEWFCRLVEIDHALAERVNRGAVRIQTPSGGAHVYVRVPVDDGNQKLAVAAEPFTDRLGKIKSTIIETRGEGGYVVAPPSPGYRVITGRFGELGEFSAGEWETMKQAARDLDEQEQPPPQIEADLRPGDDYNARGPGIVQLLVSHGWAEVKGGRDCVHLVRPGKDPRDGHSATANHNGNGIVHVFSSNAAPFAEGRDYSAFSAYALLEHAGDFAAAARKLASEGYGTPRESREIAQRATQTDSPPPRGRQAMKIAPALTESLKNDSVTDVQHVFETKLAVTASYAREPDVLIPRGKVSMLVGEGGSGKTYLAYSMALSVATGRDCCGTLVPRGAGRALFFGGEMSLDDFRLRGRRIVRQADMTAADIERGGANLDVIPLDGILCSVLDKYGEPTREFSEWLEIVRKGDYSLVVVDPLSRFGGNGVEENAWLATRFVALFQQMARAPSAPAVLLIHHTSKVSRGGQKTSSGAARGTSALTDAVRWQGNLEKQAYVANQTPMVVLRQTKANDSPAMAPIWLAQDREAEGALRAARRAEIESYLDAVSKG